MDYEQKYKEALGRMMKSLYGGLYGGLHGKTKEEAEKYFTELKESEDEKVRKELISFLQLPHPQFVGERKQEKWLAWLEKQGQEKHLSEPIKDYQGSFTCWNNAHDFRPKHLQRCICYDKYMGGVYCYVYDDISKYWCTQTTEEHDSDGDNHISDYADYRITLWMPLPNTSFYPSKSLLEKQGESKYIPKYKIGDYVKNTNYKGEPIYEIIYMDKECYICEYRGKEKMGDKTVMHFSFDNPYLRLVQKPVDKAEPKFHEGDWVTNSIETVQITGYDIDYGYQVNYKGKLLHRDTDIIEKEYHLWTIKDAKDGDILVNGSNIFIFSHLSDTRAMGYCHINLDDGRFYDDKGKNECFGLIDAVFSPATKEQRDLLFQKMKEAGYTFDFDKKELRKIEQNLANSAKPCKNDSLLDLLNKMPSCITVDGIDYHFVMKKTIAFMAFYEGEGEGSGKVIFWMAGEPIAMLTKMLEKLKEEGLLEGGQHE